MTKTFILIFLCLTLASCDHLGTNQVAHLIDLTPRLEKNSDEAIKLLVETDKSIDFTKVSSYKIATDTIIATPIMRAGVIYTLDQQGFITAFSTKEHKILWSTATKTKKSGDHLSHAGGLQYNDGKLYITNGTRDLVILDSSNGVEILRKEFPDTIHLKPLLIDDKVVVQTVSNQLIAYDISASRLAWIHEGGAEMLSSQNNMAPIRYNNSIIASYTSGELVLIDAESGKDKWLFNTTSILNDIATPSLDPTVLISNPIINSHYLYFATSKGQMIKIDLDNGQVIWNHQISDIQSMSLVEKTIFITTNARQVAAISTDTGNIKWTGDLISAQERGTKKPKAVLFQAPFITMTQQGYAINIVSSGNELYRFVQDQTGLLPSKPEIIKVSPCIKYYLTSCCANALYFIHKNKADIMMLTPITKAADIKSY